MVFGASKWERTSRERECEVVGWVIALWRSRAPLIHLPIDALHGFANAQAIAELIKDRAEGGVGAVQVFAFGNDLQVVVAADAVAFENVCEGLEIGGVGYQQLVLVELNFHGPARAQGSQAGAAIVQQQFFEVAAMAFQYCQIDM